MRPILLQLGPFALYSYGTMLVIGLVSAALAVRRPLAIVGVTSDRLINLLLFSMVASLFGARLAFSALNQTSSLVHGGLSFFGGFAFGAPAVVILAVRWRIPIMDLFDAMVPGLALGEAITRIGCDIFGKPTIGWWGVQHNGTLVHPVQLYSFAMNLAIYIILKRVRPQYAGFTSGLYLILLGASRFFLEFFRSSSTSGLTWGQAAGVAAILLGTVFLTLFPKRPAVVSQSRFTWMDLSPIALIPIFFTFAGK